MARPTLQELKDDVHVLAGATGQSKGDDRIRLTHDLTVAKLAYRTVQLIEDGQINFSQADADYICSILASRVTPPAEDVL